MRWQARVLGGSCGGRGMQVAGREVVDVLVRSLDFLNEGRERLLGVRGLV